MQIPGLHTLFSSNLDSVCAVVAHRLGQVHHGSVAAWPGLLPWQWYPAPRPQGIKPAHQQVSSHTDVQLTLWQPQLCRVAPAASQQQRSSAGHRAKVHGTRKASGIMVLGSCRTALCEMCCAGMPWYAGMAASRLLTLVWRAIGIWTTMASSQTASSHCGTGTHSLGACIS